MKKIIIKPEFEDIYLPYKNDVKRIVEVFHNNDIECSEVEAFIIWEKYSHSLCANWLMLPEDDKQIMDSCSPFFIIEE